MNQPTPESQQADFQTSGHGRNLVLVAILLLVIPMIVIGVLSNVSEDEQRLVACRVTIRVNGKPLTSGSGLAVKSQAGLPVCAMENAEIDRGRGVVEALGS